MAAEWKRIKGTGAEATVTNKANHFTADAVRDRSDRQPDDSHNIFKYWVTGPGERVLHRPVLALPNAC